uniref:Uncharacterized protein n=1 Tax=Podoviridae sp. ct8Lf7 TaxID=2827723 RepID=A0A8S5S0P8_9CAUD|nr:MAG TPA: hypothetical protein [Podoviridae sp. ct8Lf7]
MKLSEYIPTSTFSCSSGHFFRDSSSSSCIFPILVCMVSSFFVLSIKSILF